MLNADENINEMGNYSKVSLNPHSSIVLQRQNLYRGITRKACEEWSVNDVDMNNYVPVTFPDMNLNQVHKETVTGSVSASFVKPEASKVPCYHQVRNCRETKAARK